MYPGLLRVVIKKLPQCTPDFTWSRHIRCGSFCCLAFIDSYTLQILRFTDARILQILILPNLLQLVKNHIIQYFNIGALHAGRT